VCVEAGSEVTFDYEVAFDATTAEVVM